MAVRLCDHYNSSLYSNFYGAENFLESNVPVTSQLLKTYLDCNHCEVLTPTIGYAIPGALGALVKTVIFSILRPFAQLIAYFIL